MVVIEDLAGLDTGKVLDVDLCVIGAGAAGVTIAKQLLGSRLGTTRMSRHPADGVAMMCRAHGVDNLYLAGCSVFPTGGHANPTLTIVALAIRLSDHLRAQLGKKREPAQRQAVGA
jgi:choline dehydrogenase-like flavoprotein